MKRTCTQDEKALFDAAIKGDVFAVRRLIARHVNVDCTPNEVCITTRYTHIINDITCNERCVYNAHLHESSREFTRR